MMEILCRGTLTYCVPIFKSVVASVLLSLFTLLLPMANFTELDRIDEEIRRIDLESYLHEHLPSTSIVDSENEVV